MIFDMPPLTFAHVVISLIGIASGFVVLAGFFTRRRMAVWNAIFLLSNIATSVTGFIFFPFEKFLPSHGVAIVALVVLAVACAARYLFVLKGAWSRIYAVTSVLALYLNVFVLVIQSFLKVPSLKALAPTQKEPPFQVTQLVVLVVFRVLGVVAAIRYRSEPSPPPA
jgi:hypothetical protein